MNKTKRKIFKTAIKLFSEKGFDNAGIEEITAVSGVAKGSLYYHFETKEEIFDTLLDSGFKLLENSVEIKCPIILSLLDVEYTIWTFLLFKEPLGKIIISL